MSDSLAISPTSADPHEIQISTLFIGLIGVMTGAIAVITYQCITACFRQRTEEREAQPGAPDTQMRIRSIGATNPTVAMLPVSRYSKNLNEQTCAVCLSEFKIGAGIRVLPICLHVFHVSCIDKWLNQHANCPLCRSGIAVNSQDVILPMPADNIQTTIPSLHL